MRRVHGEYIAEDGARKAQSKYFVDAALREYNDEDVNGQIGQTQWLYAVRADAVPKLEAVEQPAPLHKGIHGVYGSQLFGTSWCMSGIGRLIERL